MKKAATTDRRALLILGMHRSGTSAVTRVVNMLGAEIGDNLIPPGDDNPSGFWEHAEVVRINEKLLKALGRTWYDMRDMPEGWLDSAASKIAFEQAVQLIRRDFGTSRWCAVKDPRMCLTARLWINAFRAEEFEVGCLFVVRDPREVVESLHRRNDWPRASLYLMWVQYLLEAVARTQDCPRSMVTYDRVLADWRAEVKRVAADLHFTWPVGDGQVAGDIDGFVDPHQRHHQSPAGSGRSAWSEPGVPALVDKLYKNCVALVDGHGGWDAFGSQRAEFRKAAQLYAAHVDRLLTERWDAESRAQTAESQLAQQTAITKTVHQDLQQSREAVEARLYQIEQGLASHVHDVQTSNVALSVRVAEQAAVTATVHQDLQQSRKAVEARLDQIEQGLANHVHDVQTSNIALSAQIAEQATVATTVQQAMLQAREEFLSRSEELSERFKQRQEALHRIEARLQRQHALLNTALLRLEQMAGDHAVLNAQGNKLDAHGSKLDAIDAMLRSELQDLREARGRSDARLAGVKASTSWRLTKPLRWLSIHVFRRPPAEP